jgi:hypothetical protein
LVVRSFCKGVRLHITGRRGVIAIGVDRMIGTD